MVELLWLMTGCSTPTPAPAPPEPQAKTAPRVVTIGPAITEIALKLAPEAVVGIDAASKTVNPKLPDVGHARQVSAEGVLSLEPTLVLITDAAGPDDVIEQLESAVAVKRLSHERTVAGVRTLITDVADALHANPAKLEGDLDTSCKALPQQASEKKALFVYARGGGTLNVSGTGTAAHAMLGLAGLQNAVTGYDGYKPLTPEAAVAANPDFLVFTEHGLEGLGGVDALAEIPGLAQLDAVAQGRVAAVDDFDLLAFGLGTCDGAAALAKATSP